MWNLTNAQCSTVVTIRTASIAFHPSKNVLAWAFIPVSDGRILYPVKIGGVLLRMYFSLGSKKGRLEREKKHREGK